jgi:histone H3/H4
MDAFKRARNSSSPIHDNSANIPKMTTGAIAALTDLAFSFITENVAPDLEAFSKHANRRTITENDVLLAARKNPNGLLDRLKQVLEDKRADAQGEKRTRAIHHDSGEKNTTWSPYDIATSSSSSNSSSSNSSPGDHQDSSSRKRNKTIPNSTTILLESSQEDCSTKESSTHSTKPSPTCNNKSLSFSKIAANRDSHREDSWLVDDLCDEEWKSKSSDDESEDELITFDTVIEHPFDTKQQSVEYDDGYEDETLD